MLGLSAWTWGSPPTSLLGRGCVHPLGSARNPVLGNLYGALSHSYDGLLGFPGGSVVKSQSVNAGGTTDVGSIPGSGRSPGGGLGNPLQYSCLENPTGTGAWRATVHGAAKRRT